MRVWLFDIDGTLIVSGGAGQHATRDAVSDAFGRKVNMDGVGFAGRTDRAISSDVFQLNGIPDTDANWHIFREAYLEQLSSSLSYRKGRILPGVLELLDRLDASSGNALGLLTGNLREGAQRKLTHYGLWQRFLFGGFGDLHRSRDDVARDALDAATEHVGETPHDVWVIGDTIHDVQCARAIGAKVIAVGTGGHNLEELADSNPDWLVPDLRDAALLNAIFSG